MSDLPLEGIRVVDLGQVFAGSTCSMMLAGLGAEVIKVESHKRPDVMRLAYVNFQEPGFWNLAPNFHHANVGKKGITLNLEDPRGKDLFKRLVAVSDIVVENFTPRVMKSLGLDYKVLRAINPGIIYVQIPGFGTTGPLANSPGFAFTLEPAAGVASITGYRGGPPAHANGQSDQATSSHACFAAVAALAHRAKTGEGQHVEAAIVEVMATLMNQPVADYTMNGRVWERFGNRQPGMAPHDIYRCKGGDQEWLVIAVGSDEEWQRFCEAIGNPEWTRDPRFQTMAARLEHQDELDEFVGSWTSQYDKRTAFDILRRAGVPAAPGLRDQEWLDDPYFNDGDHLQWMDAPQRGQTAYVAWPVKVDGERVKYGRPAPALGQHNREILVGLLGVTEEEYQSLEQDDVIGTGVFGMKIGAF